MEDNKVMVGINGLPSKRLADIIGKSASKMTSFLSKYGLPNSDYYKSFLECIGFLISHLHLYAALDDHKIHTVVDFYRLSQEYNERIFRSAEFYSMTNYKRLKSDKKEEFWYVSVLYQNLLHPGTCREECIDLTYMDFFKVTNFWIEFNSLLVSLSENIIEDCG